MSNKLHLVAEKRNLPTAFGTFGKSPGAAFNKNVRIVLEEMRINISDIIIMERFIFFDEIGKYTTY